MLLLAGLFSLSSCSDDDDYAAATGNVISTVETGDASVTAISATITGKVLDLTKQDASSYTVGVVYGTNPDPTTAGSKQPGTIDETGNVTTTLSGLTKGNTYYYATYVQLQGIVTKYGDVKSFVATDAQIATADAVDVTCTKATLAATVNGLEGILVEGETTMHYGFKISTSEANVQNGIDYPVSAKTNNVSQRVENLLPGTTYYYTSYFELADGFVYGDTKSFTTSAQDMEYVDLGLSVLWAKCNLGAEAEQESGILLGYGDVTGMNQSTYLIDYNSAEDIAGTAKDILSHVNIDNGALMHSTTPTADQISELIAKTTQTEAEVEGVKGIKFTGRNGNSIFLPYTGYRAGTTKIGEGNQGLYWSGNNYSVASDYSHTLNLTNGTVSSGLSARNLGLAIRSVRQSPELKVDNSKLVVGDIEGNGRIRIEIFNQYGSTGSNPGITAEQIKFTKNMVVTFKLSGVSDNMKEGTGSHVAGLEYADASWDPSRWSDFTSSKYDANITGDGVYTVWMETGGNEAEGAAVFCIDINNLSADAIDPSKIKAEIQSIKFDVDPSFVMDFSKTEFVNKDGDNTNGRIEIYNEYGNTKANGVDASALSFVGNMIVNFTITGIDGNLKDSASKNYRTELSYSEPNWTYAYWGGSEFGRTYVKGDGTYEVSASLTGQCNGAVVWTIELYDLWKDLVDTSKVKVKINSVLVPGK